MLKRQNEKCMIYVSHCICRIMGRRRDWHQSERRFACPFALVRHMAFSLVSLRYIESTLLPRPWFLYLAWFHRSLKTSSHLPPARYSILELKLIIIVGKRFQQKKSALKSAVWLPSLPQKMLTKGVIVNELFAIIVVTNHIFAKNRAIDSLCQQSRTWKWLSDAQHYPSPQDVRHFRTIYNQAICFLASFWARTLSPSSPGWPLESQKSLCPS